MKITTTMKMSLIAGLAGAAAAYLSDPEKGDQRRDNLRKRKEGLADLWPSNGDQKESTSTDSTPHVAA